MKWELASQATAAIKKYQLTEGDSIKLELKYNPSQHSVRISSEESHRLFFIDKTGLWHNKTILKNEYGVEIGKLSFDKLHNTGSIDVEGKRYLFTIRQSELVLFEHSVTRPMSVVELSPAASSYSIEECACYLLGLCWHGSEHLVYA